MVQIPITVQEPCDGGFLSFTESIDAIPAGETLTINPDPFDLSEVPDGITLSLKLIADPNEEVEESDEANNEKLITSDISLTTGLDEVLVSVSNRLKIAGNEIEVNLPENNEIELSVYDINGNLVSNVFKGSLTKGIHRFAHTMKSNALYFCRLSNGSGSITKKIVLQ